jgi:hypothetical protein
MKKNEHNKPPYSFDEMLELIKKVEREKPPIWKEEAMAAFIILLPMIFWMVILPILLGVLAALIPPD